MRVGIFDSGLGGINVLSSLLKEYPHNEYIFFGDTKNLPYGSKSKEELMTLASAAIDFLLTKKVDIIIIACGTISSNCYQELKEKYQIPLYDIITPTKRYLINSDYQNIGVIGTVKTIESKIFAIPEKKVLMKETPTFVPIIESNAIIKEEKHILEELSCFRKSDILVLGCTHYPLLKEVIEEKLKVKTLDMGECLAKEIKLAKEGSSSITLYFSLINDNLLQNVSKILSSKYEIKEK